MAAANLQLTLAGVGSFIVGSGDHRLDIFIWSSAAVGVGDGEDSKDVESGEGGEQSHAARLLRANEMKSRSEEKQGNSDDHRWKSGTSEQGRFPGT